ncbi:response regulator [Allomesorhizobium alhagi]|uniref:Regulatory protein VirG n=1 Tax=Mesorhizobium alhagi CCNWXJ12-2 TaxID=1107882 RepID=H0HVL1_9HYPH|nr:two component transcriptional regulator [Mesorhizobium alhagi CCNWXJ12-2]
MTTLYPPRLIVVDDEEGVRETLADYLGQQGFDVRTAEGGLALDAHLAAGPADLIMLDVNMPGEDGFAIARRLRASNSVPIIMVTAAGDVIDRVVGLEIGADDYVAKPFDLRELHSRLRAVLRRLKRDSQSDLPNAGSVAVANRVPQQGEERLIPFGKVMLDLAGHCLVASDGDTQGLTSMEMDLLRVFVENPHRVLSRERLFELAHDRATEPFNRSIDIRITRLRRKIEIDPAKPEVIRTIRGVGYLFAPPKTRA